MPVTVRYLEVDAQGVVFNAWYLAWFDEAMAAFLAAPRAAVPVDDGRRATTCSWCAPRSTGRPGVGFGDRVEIAVSTARIGRTSFALDFEVRRDGHARSPARPAPSTW